ncbi:MAG: hypothetical protein MZV64_74270 [Ignavibacteriales bacterium]|nr:hypothetical protein [Ignavibacteriales bacterium]
MAMPDAIDALAQLAGRAAAERLTPTGLQHRRLQPLGRGDPRASSSARSRTPRSASRPTTSGRRSSTRWPADVDDSAARRDWGHAPAYDQRAARSTNT